MAEPIYKVRDLKVSVPDMARKPLIGAAPRLEILKGLSLELEAGQVHGFLDETKTLTEIEPV